MKLIKYTFLSFITSVSIAAQDIQLSGTITLPLSISEKPAITTTLPEILTLLKVELSEHAREKLNARVQNTIEISSHEALSFSSLKKQLPAAVQLGMNKVPVLNQGAHGTCTTFANTAAINAALNKGDYISQLCQLELGNYLEKTGYALSGWDGAWGHTVLHQMATFGIVNKKQQASQGCGGLKSYPLIEARPESVISAEDYHQISEPIDEEQVTWSSELDIYQAFSDDIDPDTLLLKVKKALQAGDRLTIGMLLTDINAGVVGAVGRHKAAKDTWILTSEILNYLRGNPDFAGHEMVITGYDDNAVATDEYGRKYYGLLTLRNSWGNKFGNNGDFYMSYIYFKLLVVEINRIRSASLSKQV